MRSLLAQMARIERMERGTLSRMAGRAHYNHQTWTHGRNVVRYVQLERIAALQEAIDGYRSFKKLAEQYADQIIRRTRAQTASHAQNAPTRNKGESRTAQ